MTGIERFEMRNNADARRVLVIQPVPGIDAQPNFMRQRCRDDEFLDFRRRISRGPGVGVGAGMQFDEIGADIRCGANLGEIWIDKKTDDNTGALEPRDGRP